MKRVRNLVLSVTGAVAAMVALTACGGATVSSGAAPALAPATSRVALTATQSSSLGAIVTDSSGHTVYRYDKDSASPPMSHCTGACAQAWPPVLDTTAAKVQLQGITRSAVGTITRSNGTWQLTLDGWPLYEFAGDTQQGDIRGQGMGGTWWAVTPTGARITKQVPSSTQAPVGGGGGGY
jgi:predicted lipoprotein with Yx(FWY)xxD motif